MSKEGKRKEGEGIRHEEVVGNNNRVKKGLHQCVKLHDCDNIG